MKCPVCRGELSPRDFRGTEVDVCATGCGAWFDQDELRKVEESGSADAIDAAFPGQYTDRPDDEERNEPDRHCPKDGETMQRYEWNIGSGIFFDRCTKCRGLWLDEGEVEGFAFYIKNFRSNPPELTPELRAKMDAIRMKTEADYDAAIQDSTDRVFNSMRIMGGNQDSSLIDDLLRGLTRLVVR